MSFLFSKSILVLSVIALLAGCSRKHHDDGFNTGDPQLEKQEGALKPEQLKPGATVFVASERLNVRSDAESEDNVVATLETNDQIQVVDPTPVGPQKLIAVKVIKADGTASDSTVYTSAKYLNAAPVTLTASQIQARQYFVISNIATEKLRVYRKCTAEEACKNKMVFEQDVVDGEDEDGTKTDVGSYRIVSWDKFYETPGVYPAWYKESYPPVPPPHSSVSAWFKSEYMPDGKGSMRGAFGWYTAKVQPNPDNQWMHGTGGWGADKKKLIQFKDGIIGHITNLFHSIRSHGCTRIDNESIAYLRSLLPIGTTYVKVYAKEAYRDPSLKGYPTTPGSWDYILTKVGAGITNKNEVADRETVLQHGTPRSEYIEEGTLSLDQHPDADAGGDLYKIGSGAFHGYFLVDEGSFVDYKHPAALRVGGYSDHAIPSSLVSTDNHFTIPTPPRRNNNHQEYEN